MSDRQAGDSIREIEITPAMLAAGADAFADAFLDIAPYDPSVDRFALDVAKIYRAMEERRLGAS